MMAFDGSKWGIDITEDSMEHAVQGYLGVVHSIRFGAAYGGQYLERRSDRSMR